MMIDEDKIPYGEVVKQQSPPVDQPSDTRTAVTLTIEKRNIKFHIIFLAEGYCEKVGDTVESLTTYNTITCGKNDVLTPEKNATLFATVGGAVDLLSSMLTITPTQSINVPSNSCNNGPAFTVYDSDFVVFVSAGPNDSPSSSTLAWAQTCVRDSATPNRPTVGWINIVPSRLGGTVSQLQVRVAAHELSHALGFSALSTGRQDFYDEDGTYHSTGGMKKVYRDGLGKYVNLIVTPRVIEKAKDHFGCETLDGVEIEDGGGAGTAGSHWKGRIFLEEAMVGVITTAALFYSSVTLALFEDRGYYTPDYSKAEDNYNFGYKKGCDFLMKTCKANTDSGVADEFCFTKDSATKQRCTYDRQGIGRCNVQSYDGLSQMYQYMSDPSLGGSMETLDYCPVVSAYDNAYCVMKGEGLFNFYGHEFAPTSRCFESTLMTNGFPNAGYGPRCIPTACSPEGRLYLRIQGQTASCPEDGSEGFADTSHLLSVEGKVKCPEASFICRGRESSGLSTIPTTATSPTVTHSALTFSVTTEEEGTCEERMEKCKKIAEFYPLCDYFTRMLQQCMSRKCSQEMAMLIRDTIGPEVRSRCRRNFQEQAGVCFDSWSGAKSLCGLVNGALGFSVRNSIMVSLTALLIALFL